MTLIEILESREEALNAQQVAELLGVSDKHIYELAADGTLPAFRVGKALRFDPQDVADWLRKKKPSDEQHSARKPEKREGPKSDRKAQKSISLANVWRRKISSLEAAVAMNGSVDDDSVRNS